MAFTTSNVRVSYFGDMKVQAGAWSCLGADAPGTVNFDGGQVYLASFDSQDNLSGPSEELPYSVAGANPCVITVYAHNPTTQGRYIIIGA